MNDGNCPKCGYGLGEDLGRYRMLNCPSCGTSLFLQDDRLTLAGDLGVMHDAPLLFGLGDEVRIGGRSYHVVGHARYSYGRGTWDEFWAPDRGSDGVWISVDEGDVVVQVPQSRDLPDLTAPPELGSRFSFRHETFMVSEAEEATCVALRGNFPELLRLGERFRFVNATDESGALLSVECGEDSVNWYLGQWVDPFDVKVTRG
jgi:hypothetical protein